ncbi:MAG: glycosyltransferase family 2 protein, partial [Flavobacteriales bacterium]
IQLDGDGQHIAAEIPKLLHAYRQGYDIVIGSRFIDKSGFQSSAIRRAGIGYFKYLIKLLTKQLIRDCTSGFRLFNKEAMALAAEYYPDEYPEPEAIVLFTHAGLQIGEVPVRMRKRQGGKSSIGFFNSIYYMFKVSLAIVFTYIRTQNLKKS